MWSVVLIFVVGLDGGDLLERDFFGGFFIELFLDKAVKMSASEYHPSFFPLFEDTGAFDEKSFFDFVVFDVSFIVLLRFHLFGWSICLKMFTL